MLARKVMEELKVGDVVTFCFDELQSTHYIRYQNEYPGQWVFDGFSKCPVNCDVPYCKGKMNFSNGSKKVYRCLIHNVTGGRTCPISILSNFRLDDALFEI